MSVSIPSAVAARTILYEEVGPYSDVDHGVIPTRVRGPGAAGVSDVFPMGGLRKITMMERVTGLMWTNNQTRSGAR